MLSQHFTHNFTLGRCQQVEGLILSIVTHVGIFYHLTKAEFNLFYLFRRYSASKWAIIGYIKIFDISVQLDTKLLFIEKLQDISKKSLCKVVNVYLQNIVSKFQPILTVIYRDLHKIVGHMCRKKPF